MEHENDEGNEMFDSDEDSDDGSVLSEISDENLYF